MNYLQVALPESVADVIARRLSAAPPGVLFTLFGTTDFSSALWQDGDNWLVEFGPGRGVRSYRIQTDDIAALAEGLDAHIAGELAALAAALSALAAPAA